MKTLTKSLLALGVALSFTACGGGSIGNLVDDTNYNDTNYNDDYNDYTPSGTTVSQYDFGYSDYLFTGTSSYGENVSLYFYANGTYEYYRGSEYFYGYYSVDSSGILMQDSTDGGSYYLYSDSYGQFSEGGTYSCPGLGRELYISSIQTL